MLARFVLGETMNTKKFQKLLTVLIISSALIVGATQRFDTIIAKKVVVNGFGGIELSTGRGSLDISGNELVMDVDSDTTMVSSVDDVLTITLGATAGHVDIATGNLKVGNGTPTFTQDGEDAYIEGTLELAENLVMGAQTTFSVVLGIPITPTGLYQPLTSGVPTAGALVSPIAAGGTIGERLVLHNINATQVITIDGTGTTVECQADVVLGAQDTLELLWNGADWICLTNYDNS